MLRPSDLVDCAEDFAVLFAQLDSDINQTIAAHIVSGKIGATVKWQAEMKKHGKYVYRAVLNALKRINPKAAKVLKEAYQKGAQKSVQYPKEMQKLLKETDFNPQEAQWLLTLVLAGVRKTNGVMTNLTMTLAQTAQNAFSNAMDRAYMQVVSGAFSKDQALRMAVHDLVAQGYQKIAYPSGVQTSVEAAARRALVTGINQTVAEVQLQMCEEFHTDLVEVSAHAGARPTHAVWQGKVYCISGATEKHGDFRTETGYGTGEGLCGWNCYHTFFPFIEGVTERSFSEDPSKEYLGRDNDEMYEQSQKQRAYERAVREAKKKCASLKAATDNADSPELKRSLESDYAKAKKLVQMRTKRLKDYCKETRRTYYPNRTAIGGTGIKESKTVQPTVQAAAKQRGNSDNIPLNNTPKDDIIKTQNAFPANTASPAANADYPALIILDRQFGKKAGKHMREWGLDPSSAEDREKLLEQIKSIQQNPDEIRLVKWEKGKASKQRDKEVRAYIKGDDVVLVRLNGEFITIMKGGRTNSRVQGGGKA